MWYDLTIRAPYDARSLSADVFVPPESPWFSGHFPGNPILPGVAQLRMVVDAIRHAFDESVRVVEVSRVRFKQMVLPGDRLVVTAEARPNKVGSYTFRITKGDELVCNGTMVVAPAGLADLKDQTKGDQ